jgi:peptidyl-prolyl cis-trans isomerase SurA
MMTARRMTLMTTPLKAALLGALLLGTALPATAQDGNPFAPVLVVNGSVVSAYEVEQRALFLQVLRAPGDPAEEALKGLTEDRLGAQAADALNLSVTAEQVLAGMTEFAARANLSAEDFVKAIAEEGVAPETFRDFVTAGLIWREVVRTKFGGTVKISDVQIDRALADKLRKPSVKVLLSELVVPVQDGDVGAALETARQIKAESGNFGAAARQYSASPSADRGGRLDWMPLENLPPAIAGQVLALASGEVSDPVVVPNAVVLFQLNGLSEAEAASPVSVRVEYAEFALAPGADVASMQAGFDGCDDLYPLARDQGADRLRVTTATMAEIPANTGLALAPLDAGESVVVDRGGVAVLLMLCARTPLPEAPDDTATTEVAAAPAEPVEPPTAEELDAAARQAALSELGNQRLALLADAYMEELRSEAIIRQP